MKKPQVLSHGLMSSCHRMLPSYRFFLPDILKLKTVNCKLYIYIYIFNVLIIINIILLLFILMHLMYIYISILFSCSVSSKILAC